MLLDKHNVEMFDRVRPRFWRDTSSAPNIDEESSNSEAIPTTARGKPLKYDMVVIGGGAAGMVTSAAASIYGAKACMIERNVVGGDCLYTGCVPSKAFLKSCKVYHSAKEGKSHGVEAADLQLSFPRLMERMRQIRAEISKADAADKFQNYYGLDIFMGHANFTGPNQIEINGQVVDFFKACIATGASPRIPQIPGATNIRYYTSDSIFNLTERPESMLIIGGGPVGCELGQGFARLGT